MNRLLLLTALFISFTFVVAFSQSNSQTNIYFEKDKFVLDASSHQKLSEINEHLEAFNEYEIEIVSHTDLAMYPKVKMSNL